MDNRERENRIVKMTKHYSPAVYISINRRGVEDMAQIVFKKVQTQVNLMQFCEAADCIHLLLVFSLFHSIHKCGQYPIKPTAGHTYIGDLDLESKSFYTMKILNSSYNLQN